MKNYIFKVGVRLKISGEYFRILRILDARRVQLESEKDGRFVENSLDELFVQYAEKRLEFIDDSFSVSDVPDAFGRPLSTFSTSIQDDALRKKRYLDFLLQFGPFISTPTSLGPLITECARKINDLTPPSPSTAYRWHREFVRSQRDCRALIPRHDRKGGNKCRLHPDVVEILNTAIDKVYLTEQRNSGDDVYAEVVHQIDKKNQYCLADDRLTMPSRATIYRALAKLDKYEESSARFGQRIANMKFRTSGLGIRAERILERVEIDHTPLDLFVIDETTELPLGRPTVTIALDAYSKMPAGMHVGFSGTSIEAVFACLRHALIPKTYIKESYPEIEHDWPCYGHIETLICDNGLEFHSKELERVAFELGTQIQFCPKRQAYYKGSIERFLKTVNYQFARMIPGHSFAKWFHREDYDPLKDAVLTFNQMMRYLHKWLIDIYAQKLHRGINSSPYRRWCEGALENPPRLIADLNRLDITLARSCERTLFHYGIELNNLRYNDSALLMLRRQHGNQVKVEVRYYFEDISLIHVIDPITKHAIPVPALEHEYAKGLSLEQHRLICSRAREINKGSINFIAISNAKAEIRAITHELSFSKLQRKRQRSAKLNGIKQQSTPKQFPENPVEHKHIEKEPASQSNQDFSNLPDIGAIHFVREIKKRGQL